MTTSHQASGRSAGFRFYTQSEYRAELIRLVRAAKAGDRLLLMSMTFEPTEPDIAVIMHEVELAASRGVRVSLAIDAHSFLINPAHLPGPLWNRRSLPKRLPAIYRNKLDIITRINAYPHSHAGILNLPASSFQLPIAGRSHIKAAIINDHIFLGGCNLQGSNNIDLMVHWQATGTADWLHSVLTGIIRGGHAGQALNGQDVQADVGPDARILIDSGTRRQSLIFDEAMALIDAAEDWLVITCQFFPNSLTARHLVAAARRGVKVEVIYAHPKHHGLIGGFGQQISILRERTRVPKSLFQHALGRKDPMLHAKLIACDKGLMIGSHNYVQAGVILGTAEIALKLKSTVLAREAVQTLHHGLGR
ncbi:MAG TPA: phospholipase D-like domain-containing protein [Candidatus Saccharimonadales bacterium]|nr:phospholipase D-like domain-containing protein [Candidatus Saccharimonadales bacterium]